MARTRGDKDAATKKQGRIKQLRAVFTMTRQGDPKAIWWMLLGGLGVVAAAFLIGLAIGHEIYLTILGIPLGIMAALVIMARRAEKVAYGRIAGQRGASLAALQNMRRGWSVEQQPVAVDPRTQDMVFRAVGRGGVVLITEGPLPRVARLAEQERKRVARVVPNVPITVVYTGDDEGQVELRKLSGTLMRMKGTLSKTEVSEVAKRLRAIGGVRPPIPKGIDPLKARPDRRMTRGR
jgi:hypothetical protein